jgi:hypothetical protein
MMTIMLLSLYLRIDIMNTLSDNIKTIIIISAATMLAASVLLIITNLEASARQQGQKQSVRICCSWDNRLSQGTLAYKIIGFHNNNPEMKQAVYNAIDAWNTKIAPIKLIETAHGSNNAADIVIKFGSKAPKIKIGKIVNGGMSSGVEKVSLTTPGISNIKFDGNGLINQVLVTISPSTAITDSSGSKLSSPLDSTKVEAIATHEIGHALGLGHANFVTDLMSPILTDKTRINISQCDVNAVVQANSWKLVESNSNSPPHPPLVDHVDC